MEITTPSGVVFLFMDPNQNTGSFASMLGGSSSILEAMKRRGMGASVTDQTSPAAPGVNQVPPPPPQTNPDAGLSTQGTSTPTQEQSELNVALKALGEFVKSEGKLRRDLVNLRGQGVV